MGPASYFSVEEIKALRVEVDALIQKIEMPGAHENPDVPLGGLYDLAQYQARVHLIETKMWLGKMLEGLGTPFPKELADKANVQ